jgi:hypothetical protein
VVPFGTAMHDHPAATRHLEPGTHAEGSTSAQRRFELERSEADAGALGAAAWLRARLPFGRQPAREATPTAIPRHLEGLEAIGCVTLEALRTPSGRRRVDHLVVAPSGIYSIEDRPWRGQVAVADDSLYVDGRLRAGVPEGALRTSGLVQSALGEELAPFGLGITPVICLPDAETAWRSWQVQGVLVVCGRSLARVIRQRPLVMGADTVVRLALAADRLLESD